MHLLPDGTRRYAPKDLVAYLEGDFAAWCERFQAERAGLPAEILAKTGDLRRNDEPEQRLAAEKGTEHELSYLAALRERTPNLVEIERNDPEAAAKTLAAIRAAAPVIYQARLEAGDWHGYPDFLVRSAGTSSLGDHHYVPWDTKLARSPKPYFLVQLCAYAALLENVQGVRPARLVIVLGDSAEQPFRTDDFFYLYRRLEQAFLTFQAAWRPDARPDPGLDRSWGQWSDAAEALLQARDHPSLTAQITRAQVRRLEESGVATLHALARLDGRAVPGITTPVLERLATQARLQVESADTPAPRWLLRPPTPEEPRRGLAQLPAPSAGDVFFDMEGFPFADGGEGLEYLFGAVTVEQDGLAFHDWWAHDTAEEKRAFEGFVDWAHARWRADPAMHIYHYAAYEKNALRRLMAKHATREREVDDLLRAEALVDLYAVVRQGFFVGTPSYSLKDIERLYRRPREGAVTDAGGSVVEYQRWLDAAEPRDWRRSPILDGIRAYNRDDCESTRSLRDWLLARQAEGGIAYVPARADSPPPPKEETTAAETLAARLLARVESGVDPDPERRRVTRLVAWLVEFHRREEKPMWWRMFDRHDMTEEELARSLDCLTGLTRTASPPRSVKKSLALEYRFDPDQDTKLHPGSKCYVAADLELKPEIATMDTEAGLLELKVGRTVTLPERLSLIPNEFVSAETIKAALLRYGEAWEAGRVLSAAVDDLLFRRRPRITGHPGGQLIDPTREPVPQIIDLVGRLDRTTLAIQGPPGTGKTWTAAAIIDELLERGKRVGIAANSHKVVLNLLEAVVEARRRHGRAVTRLYKVGDDGDDALVADGTLRQIESSEAAGVLDEGRAVVGGTAWVWSRADLEGRLDYLFIDEAGQVSLANTVAMGLAARNLVLIGDQMQLGQPSRAVHPGDSGVSCLEYVLQDRATVPEDVGVFLGVSRRLHPAVCRFISDAIYESRLTNLAETARHRVLRSAGTVLVPREAGLVFFPVEHEGCEQASNEETDLIARIVAELLGRTVIDRDGGPRPMTPNDILLVAPYNMQVRRLRRRLGAGARVGSVDKFQGQEAPVVIVSMCASSLDESPRGAEFLLSPNRLNVAVSRAEALAIVVASPGLLDPRCRSIREMRLVNLLCRLEQYAGTEQAL